MNRSTRRPLTCRRFALRPLPLALAIAITSSTLGAARAADSFTNVQQVVGATISTPNANTTNVNQTANNAYIQTGGFNIAAQDSVKVFQPSNTSNLLIQVSGYDPSAILGQLQANGRVFLSNPNGVLFGAGARIDVGSLVATNLSLDADEFMRNRVRLYDRGNSRGSVVNAGSIKADGTVALVGTEVSNLGSIEASRIGMAALTDVVVDVEGDGLIFFQMAGNRAGAKLQQLGTLTADGGLVELRAEARGTVADTVLNMDGIIQARSIGSRNGQVIIDGGGIGVTKVNGTIDVQGTEAGETGGTVKVLGDRVALGSTALIDASGEAGGGTVLVGGNYQGSGDERRASHTRVAQGAIIKANANTDGDGGTVVVWADGSTAYQGQIQARGGAQSGNGGKVEVSGKQQLAFWGTVDASAAHGALGSLLLDPTNIFVISDTDTPTGTLSADFDVLDNTPTSTGDYSVRASAINASTADITLAASNNITVNAAIDRSGTSGAAGDFLKLIAGNSITVNASIRTNNGDLTLSANSGAGTITLGADLNAGTGSVDLNGKVSLAANVGITAGDHAKFYATVDSANTTAHNLNITADEIEVTGTLGGGNALGDLTLTTSNLILTSGTAIGAANGATATIMSRTSSGNISVRSGTLSTELRLDPTDDLSRFANYATLKLGATTGTGTVAVNTDWTLPTNVVLQSGSGNISVNNSIDGAKSLTINTTGVVALGNTTTVDDENLGAGTALSSLDVTGSSIRISTILIKTTGNQTYNSPVVLVANGAPTANSHTLNGDSVKLKGITGNTAGQLLSITANSVELNGVIGNTVSSSQGIAALTVNSTGLTTLGSATTSITTSADMLFQGAVQVKADTSLTSTGGNIGFSGALDSDGTARDVALNVANTKAITLGGAVGASSALDVFTVNGAANINGGNSTTAAVTANTQDYKKNVTFGGAGTSKTLVANSLSFAASTSIKATSSDATPVVYDVTLRTDALTIGSGTTSTGGGALTLVQRTTNGNIGVDTVAIENLNLSSTGQLAALASFSSLKIGDATNTSTVEFGAGYTLAKDTTLAAATSVTLLAFTGATHDLTLDTANAVFNGNVSGVGTLHATGAATLNADLAASTRVDIDGTTTLANGTAATTRTIDAGTVELAGLATGVRNIAIKADTLNLTGTYTSSGSSATVSTHTNGTAIALESTAAAGDLEIDAATLGKFSQFSQLTIGRSDSNSTIGTTTAITLPTNLTLVSGNAAITLAGVTGAGFNLAANTTGTVTFNGNVSGVGTLSTTGATKVNADLSASTLISFGGTTTLDTGATGTTRTLDAGTVTLAGLAAGDKNITIKADTLNLTGTITANTGSTATIATHTAGRAIALQTGTAAADLEIGSATLALLSPFSQLTIGRSDSNSAIGATTAITLPTHLTLVSGGGNIALAGVTGAGFDLTTNNTGTVTFNGDVAGVRDLTVAGTSSGVVINTASIATTRKQSYNADITLGTGSASRTLSAPTLEILGTHTITAGTHALVLRADALALGGNVSGSAGSTLALATFTNSKTIGVLGGTGDLQIDSVLLNKISGFDLLTIGRSDSTATGTITVGDGGGGTITLPAKLALLSGAADIDVLNTVGSSGGTLSITSTSGDVTLAQNIGSSGANLGTLTVGTGGDITLQGIEIYANNATFTGKVVLDTNATTSSTDTHLNGGTFTFTGNVVGASDGVQGLFSSATLVKLQGDVGATTRLKTLSTENAEVGGKLYATDAVALKGNTTLKAGTDIRAASVTLGDDASSDTLSAGTFNLTIKTDEINVALLGATGGAQFGLAPLTAGNAIRISTTGADPGNILMVAPSLLAKLGSFTQMTIGSDDSDGSGYYTGAITVDHTSAISLGTALTLLSKTADISILSALQGGKALTITTGGQALVQADLGTSASALTTVTITGKTEFAGGGSSVTVRTSGNQDYQDDVTIANATTLSTSAGGVRLRKAVDAKTGSSATADLTVANTGGSARFDGNVGTTAALHSLTTNAALINGTAVTTQAAQTYHGSVTLSSASTTLTGTTVTIDGAVVGTTSGAQALVIDADAVLQGAVGTTALRLASLEVTGASSLSGGNVFTTDGQTYTGAVTLGANTTLTSTNGDVLFSGTVDGDTAASRSLTVNSAGLTHFAGVVGGIKSLSSLSTDSAGSTQLDANVTTSGAQTYNDQLKLNGSITLTSGSDVGFLNAVVGTADGVDALTVNASGQTRFAGTVGTGTVRLASLSTNSTGTTQLEGDIHTSGTVNFQDAVTVGDTLTITHGGLLTFGSTLDGAHDLTLDGGSGNAAVNFTSTVGGTTALASLTTVGTGAANFLSGSTGASTTGTQQYGGNVVLTGSNKVFNAGALDFTGSVTGISGLTLTTNGLSLGGSLSGGGALVIQTLGTSTSIGVGTGATGTLLIAQNVLGSTAGFTSLTIGRADGTGAINVGTANLGTNTTLRSGSGPISLNGAVNSLGSTAVDLSINSASGVITLAGDLGTSHALREITTNRAVSTPDAISIAASKVTLQSNTNFTLNNLTLTGSGTSLIQSAQRLVLAGDINLSGGGTLGLVSTVAPSKVGVTDTEYAGNNNLSVGLVAALREASAGIEQTGGKIVTSAGTTLYVRTTQGASINLMRADNDIQGGISAVSGRIGESVNTTRLTTPDGGGDITVGFVRVASRQINVLGQPTSDADQSLVAAGIEGDAVVLSADRINTSANNGLIRARLPYDNNQGTLTAMPGLTLELSATGLNANQAYGGVIEADRIQVSVGNTTGGYITVRPKGGASLGPGFVSLSGNAAMRPFYDGSGKVTEVPIFYNGDVPQTPQEVGALSAVTSVIEEARRQRFEEAVRTENVSARLRSGVIAEVGSGRPATEGSDSIRMPTSCTPAGESLSCQ